MAMPLWHRQESLVQCDKVGADTVPCSYVVGVAENIKSQQLGADPRMFYYLAAAQWHPEKAGLLVRVRGDAARSAGTVRRRLQQRSEEHTSELQSRSDLVCRLLLEKKKQKN